MIRKPFDFDAELARLRDSVELHRRYCRALDLIDYVTAWSGLRRRALAELQGAAE